MRARRPRSPFPSLALAAVLLLPVAGGCAGLGATPTARPDPSAPCAGADEQRRSGFYPSLEALLPTTLDGTVATTRDSGRYCSAARLGSLASAGITELHFAGAQFPIGSTGLSIVAYQAPGLTADAMADSFTNGAAGAQNITQITTQAQTIAGRHGVRLDAANGDGHQVIIVWPSAAPATVFAVLASDVADARIADAVAVMGAR